MTNTILLQGSTVSYRVYGKGKPVLLVHGFGEDGNVWHHQVEFLKDSFKLIVPDLPGSGQSGINPDMSMEGQAAVLKSILDQEKTGPSIVIGHSMGGYITLAFAEKYPESVRAFGLFSSTAFADTEEKKATRRKGIGFIKQNGAFAFLKNTSPNLFSAITKDERPELVDGFIESLSNFSAEALVLYYEAMIARPDRTHILKSTTYPILFVLGKYDTAIPLEDGLKLCHMPEKSYIHTLYRSGHMGMLEEVDESNALLKKFLTEA